MADETRTRPFHERFDVDVGIDEARRRFVVRVSNIILYNFVNENMIYSNEREKVKLLILSALGDRYVSSGKRLDYLVGSDFRRNLRALEELYQILRNTGLENELSDQIYSIIQASEVDLGIDWQPPIFIPTGARLLDETLVNDQLHWLRDHSYSTVLRPFQEGLSHFLESEQKPHLLGDVITDMYESLEALAKIVTGRPNKDLSANRESFISKVKASDHYKKLLRGYIAYANEFRHAEQEQKPRPSISRPEAESFVYLTGLFIRLAVERS